MTKAIIDLLQFLLPILLILIGLFVGRWNEKRHYESIRLRESLLARLPVTTARSWDAQYQVDHAWMEQGSVVISIDYFKRFAAGLRNLFGGNVRSYETLLDRARREAVLRLKEAAREGGADIIVNLRLDTSSINGAKSNNQNSIACIELVATGTAVRYMHEGKTA